MIKNKILYVEDEPHLGRIVKESLESRKFLVTMASDGLNALTLFRDIKPDICILDVMLPGKDGFSLARELRQEAPKIPIIFVTAKTQTSDLLQGFEAGGNDYLRKPFSLEELMARINNLLSLTQAATAGQETIKLGKFHFFPLRYELRLGDNVRKLSHREATLLQTLCESKNIPVLRKDILMKLWGDDSFFNSRNLDVYITKLREYLKADSAIEIITIKGHGYLFSVSD